jgi:hypothetical protein
VKIVDARYHALILPNGKTPVRVVVEGWGIVHVGDARRFVFGKLDTVLLVTARADLTIRAGRETRALVPVVLDGSPIAPRVPASAPFASPRVVAPRALVRAPVVHTRIELVDLKPKVHL